LGHPRDQAVVELRRRDFLPEIVGDEPSTEFPPGSVARQDPLGGSPIPPGHRLVRLWIAVPLPPPITVVQPTAAETPTPEPPAPLPDDDRRRRKLPPAPQPPLPPPPPPPPPPYPDPWTVAVVVAVLGAAAYIAFRLLRPKDGRGDRTSRVPDVEVLPRIDCGEQAVVSPGPVTWGLTLHPVSDPGEQKLEVSGPLLAGGREP